VAWFVYVVRCRDGSLYTGISNDVQARIAAHNRGQGARYTRGRQPVVLVYLERRGTRSTALRRELAIKALSRDAKTALTTAGPPPPRRRAAAGAGARARGGRSGRGA
jgi:predicted GIY-YIG superfamily endonuclease